MTYNVGDKVTYLYSGNQPIIIDNKNAKWKKIKVTCIGGKGGDGGNGHYYGTIRNGSPGKNGSATEGIITLNITDKIYLYIADDGKRGSNSPTSGSATHRYGGGGGGGGCTALEVNNVIELSAKGGKGGDGGLGYLDSSASPGSGGWGKPSGAAGSGKFGGQGGGSNKGTLLAEEATTGSRIIIEILEMYKKCIVRDGNKSKTLLEKPYLHWKTIVEGTPTEQDFLDYGMGNLNILTQKINIAHKQFTNDGTVGEGKQFSIKIPIEALSIKNIIAD